MRSDLVYLDESQTSPQWLEQDQWMMVPRSKNDCPLDSIPLMRYGIQIGGCTPYTEFLNLFFQLIQHAHAPRTPLL